MFRDKRFDDALSLAENARKDTYAIFLRAQILIAQSNSDVINTVIEQSKKAFELLLENVTDELLAYDDYLVFLLKQVNHYKVGRDDLVQGLISKLLKVKKPEDSKQLLLALADILAASQPKESLLILQGLFKSHSSDRLVQGRLLQTLVDSGNLSEALKLQQKLPKYQAPAEDEEDYVQRLIDDGMPEKRKEKKSKDVVQETKGGAEIFMPTKKRKRNIKYPKNFDPKNPGQEPDPERWLPKWQRSRFKKFAKKRGIYLKGAQGDAIVDTDVTQGITQSTAHQEAVQDKQKTNKRRKK